MNEYRQLSDSHNSRRISVFGGSQPKAGDLSYRAAYRLGKLLAVHGYTVLTGGYMGTMEAVSRGAAENGTHVIGVTCEEIEAWRPVGPNQWVIEERRARTLLERLNTLITDCDGAVALPGGVGTLTEIALMWTHLSINVYKNRPLILVGEGWEAIIEEVLEQQVDYVRESDMHILTHVADVDEAVRELNRILRVI